MASVEQTLFLTHHPRPNPPPLLPPHRRFAIFSVQIGAFHSAGALEAHLPGDQGSARSPSPKSKSDSAAADFTKVRFSGPEVQVQFRVGLRSPSPSSSPIRVGPRSPSPSPSPIREWTSKSKSNHKSGQCHRIRSTSPSPSPIRLGLRSPQVQPKVRLGAAQPKERRILGASHFAHKTLFP